MGQKPHRSDGIDVPPRLESPMQVFEGDTLLNKSDQPIMAVSGTFDYLLPDGSLKTVTWGYNFGGLFMLEPGVEPGSVIRLPPTPRSPGTKEMVSYENIRVTGAVMKDGTLWGPGGPALKAKCSDRARAGRLYVRDLLNLQRDRSPEWLLDVLASPQPLREGPLEKSAHVALRGVLYDKATHSLKGDPEVILQDLLDYLGQY